MLAEVVNAPVISATNDINISEFETSTDESFNIADVQDLIDENNGAIEIDASISQEHLLYELYTV